MSLLRCEAVTLQARKAIEEGPATRGVGQDSCRAQGEDGNACRAELPTGMPRAASRP